MSVVEKAEERWGGRVWWSAGTGGVEYGDGERETEKRVRNGDFLTG